MGQSSLQLKNVNWHTWVPDEIATLMFVQKAGKVLLIHKKRGLGAGKINGPGGKIENGETPRECAIRETEEELCITPLNVVAAGEIIFHANDMPKTKGYVFIASDYTGTPTETKEAIPIWTEIDNIPYPKMWQDDRYWLPQVLAGKKISAWFSFIAEEMIDYRVLVEAN